jgi:secreted trypsin-like serine protease
MSPVKLAWPILIVSLFYKQNEGFFANSLESYIQTMRSDLGDRALEFVYEHGWTAKEQMKAEIINHPPGLKTKTSHEPIFNETNIPPSDDEDRFPYVAFLYFEQNDKAWRCGGTLIAEDVVLTAAHCIPTHGDHYSSVTLGGIETYDDNAQENFELTSYDIHPHFELEGYPLFDIALVRLDRCSGIKPISLSRDMLRNADESKHLHVFRWEDTFDEDGYEETTRIRDSAVPLDRQCDPWRSRTDLGTLRSSHICTATTNLDPSLAPTRGDSGGALIIKGRNANDDVQVGVVSFGYSKKSSKNRVPTVHSNVETSYNWIDTTKENISQCPAG